jgi:1,4-alpha-glucan branching enzyme
MILTRKLLCCLILIVTLFSPVFTFTGFANNKEKLKVENYENITYLNNSSAPQMLSMMDVRDIGTDSKIMHAGLLFTYDDRSAKSVEIAGNFSNWKPVTMTRNKYGIWYYFQKTDSGEKAYSYKYIVDGTWIKDPKNYSKINDNASSYISIAQAAEKGLSKQITYKILSKDTVEFRFYKPTAKLISLVGDFNNWNPENDLMAKDENGIWKLTKKLSRGKTYRYKFYIDGEWEVDTYNENSGSDQLGELCSLLILP